MGSNTEMKLFSVLSFSLVNAEWQQPKWKQVMKAFGDQRFDFDWGHPLEGNSRKWSDCPAIDTSAIAGLDQLRCNGATCALKCLPGYQGIGRRRTKCRFNRKTQTWFWKNTLGSCRSCAVQEPVSLDPLMSTMCKINSNNNRKWCKMECPENHTAADSNKQFVKIACKCPRNANRDCNWYIKRKISNYENYTCTPKATPPPATTAPAGNGTMEA